MPKIYYRCSKCHEKVSYLYCSKCGKSIVNMYKCQHNYWWELMYLTMRTIFRSIKESWRAYLEYNRTIEKFKFGKIKFCHDDCKFLSPNEVNQTKTKEPHWCSLYGRRLTHSGHHPQIVSYKDCRRRRK